MKGYNNTNGTRIFLYIGIFLLLILLLLTTIGCRRDLWIYQDKFKQIELDIDWRNYFRDTQLYPNTPDPDGMTLWFFPKDGRPAYTLTTSEVRHYETYLSKGDYEALVIDYSPMEYGRQEFVGMDFARTAKVQSVASSYQPDSIPELFGPAAYGSKLPKVNENGLYSVAWEPENIANDTLQMTVETGEYDKYIPYEERNTYQSTLVNQQFQMQPLIIPWNIRIRIYVKGIYYIYKTMATVAGLADGYYLVDCKTSETPCLLQVDDWEVHTAKDSSAVAGGLGYIAKTFKTWGPMNFTNRGYDINKKQGVDELASRPADEVQINIKFLLRDRKTVRYYHFKVGNLMRCYWNEYALRIDLENGFDGQPDLPEVDAYNGIDLDGVVVPWADGGDAELEF